MDSNLTACSALESTLHDRERREERQIEKITLQQARRYGMKDRQRNGRVKYYYAGHVFVYDERLNKAITSYKYDRICDLYNPSPNNNKNNKNNNNNQQPVGKKPPPPKPKKPITSGTRFAKPILVERSKDHANHAGIVVAHESATEYIQQHPALWTSHTVIVVDMSGSMREDDVNGARCRADGVWTTLARNFCRAQLEDQSSCMYDVVSVIVMQKAARVVIYCEPLTWVLYNKLVDFREWENMKPEGHGFYKPALEKAEELLNLNHHGSCSLSLMFFSDGKPSDFFQENQQFNQKHYAQVETDLAKTCGILASRFGRRLNITCIGMADTSEKFRALQRMTNEAKEFGALATFHQPSLNTDSLSQIISSSVASSLSSKTELTSLRKGTVTSRSVRMDVERERQNAPESTTPSPDQWRIFTNSNSEQSVIGVWTWSDKLHDFAFIIDPRCKQCSKPVADSNYNIVADGGVQCQRCQACFFCLRCVATGVPRKHMNDDCPELLRARRHGSLVGKDVCPLTYNVAWKKKAFGEGAERLAYKFRFTDPKGKKFLGPIMVAKESRFVEDMDSTENYLRSKKHSYHKAFMRTQNIASAFAVRFNVRLERLLPSTTLVHVPQIEFVKPLIFELEDKEAGKTFNVLVEPLIEGKYRKFSDNHGDLAKDLKRDFAQENKGLDLVSASLLLGRKIPNNINHHASSNHSDGDENEHGGMDQKSTKKGNGKPIDLGIIEEGDEDEDGDEDEEDDQDYSSESEEDSDEDDSSGSAFFDAKRIPETDYLQAFSHYTYAFSGGRLMVVDLQGALRQPATTTIPRKTFVLTDPAIHQRRPRVQQHHHHHHHQHHHHHSHHGPKRQFGRTDLGVRGMKAFFNSHECNDVCRLLQLRDKKKQQQEYKEEGDEEEEDEEY